MKLDDFDYDLPPELIAQQPVPERGASRLLHLGAAGELRDRMFRDLPELVSAHDVMVFNDTRVINARLAAVRPTGGRVEILVERVLGPHEFLVQLRASHAPRAGAALRIADSVAATVVERRADLFRLRIDDTMSAFELLERYGETPLPPYIARAPQREDAERYQTVYARAPGAIAAPTAGLHFDDAMLAALRAEGVAIAYVTLHVGAGTFQPVRVENVADHVMHSEWYSLPAATVSAIEAARARGGRVIAVGTTSLRALETAASAGGLRAGDGETKLFVVPGYRFRVVDRLITNFHLPKSTLLMLVSAFGGMEPVRAAYRHAVQSRYRFFSYGDAMLLERSDG